MLKSRFREGELRTAPTAPSLLGPRGLNFSARLGKVSTEWVNAFQAIDFYSYKMIGHCFGWIQGGQTYLNALDETRLAWISDYFLRLNWGSPAQPRNLHNPVLYSMPAWTIENAKIFLALIYCRPSDSNLYINGEPFWKEYVEIFHNRMVKCNKARHVHPQIVRSTIH